MFKIGLMQTNFQSSSTARPFFNNDVTRDAYFTDLVDTTGTWSNTQHIVLNDNITFSVVIIRDGKDITKLLRYNYCIIIYPDTSIRFFYASLKQDSGGQVIANLELDDYTQNFNAIKTSAVANVTRASHLPNTAYEPKSENLTNIAEDVKDEKIMIDRSSLSLVDKTDKTIPIQYRSYFEKALDEEIWVYYYIKPNSFIPFATYKSEGVDTKHIILCAPLKSSWKIKRLGVEEDWSYRGLLDYLEREVEIDVINANADILRVLSGTGIPAGTNKLTVNLMPFVTNIKISPFPPFGINFKFKDSRTGIITYNSTARAVQYNFGDIDLNGFGYGCFVVNSTEYRNIEMKYLFNDVLLGKFRKAESSNFREYRLVNHTGDYIVLDRLKMIEESGDDYLGNHADWITFVVNEVLTADVTDTYIYLKNTSYFYKFSANNFMGLMANYDSGIPVFIDALSDYFATNKNSVASNNLIRSNMLANQQSQDKNAFQKQVASFVQTGVTRKLPNIISGGIEAIKTGFDRQMGIRNVNIERTTNSVAERLNYDNLQYSPPKVTVPGNILYLNEIFDNLLPCVDIYQIEEINMKKWEEYFKEFGYKIGKIYTDLTVFEYSVGSGNYLQCDILRSDAKISDEEFSRLSIILGTGVQRILP